MKTISAIDSTLFRGISENDANSMLKCLSAVRKEYKKGEYIFHMGDLVDSVGLVVKGLVQVMSEDYWGERHILSVIGEGQLFGESYACVQTRPLMVSVVANEETEVLFLNVNRVLNVCSSSCVFHNRLIHNLLAVIANKNLMLTAKMEHMSKKTIREKVLSYLLFQVVAQGSRTVELPFGRQQLADYFAVDRSALSAELSKMQKEKLITFKKNIFTLL